MEPPAPPLSSNSWIALESLVALAALGLASFFWTPKYPEAVGIVLAALVGTLNSALGAKAGGKMPEQAGDAQSVVETTSQAPPADPAA